jgi:nucleoid DNA-binding protein
MSTNASAVSKSDLIHQTYERLNNEGKDVTLREVTEVVVTLLEVVKGNLVGHNVVKLTGIGTLTPKVRNPRIFKKPSGERVTVQPKPTIQLKASPALRKEMAGE